jgi:hypothetical protein
MITASTWCGSSTSPAKNTPCLFDRSLLGGDVAGLLCTLHRVAIRVVLGMAQLTIRDAFYRPAWPICNNSIQCL